MTNNTQKILEERQCTHGSYDVQSECFSSIMTAISKANNSELTDPVSMSIAMIAVKMSRIASGNPYALDHWDDIMGYALLAKQSIEEEASCD